MTWAPCRVAALAMFSARAFRQLSWTSGGVRVPQTKIARNGLSLQLINIALATQIASRTGPYFGQRTLSAIRMSGDCVLYAQTAQNASPALRTSSMDTSRCVTARNPSSSRCREQHALRFQRSENFFRPLPARATESMMMFVWTVSGSISIPGMSPRALASTAPSRGPRAGAPCCFPARTILPRQ